ncbi:hypothetical protein E1298_24770 [Actinomadura rubrisoli]|uniref:Secreted protein n=1 Tax=Actinomadura rubrisoli TaxID=2530368 RepID=A0A4R5B7K2_9ACTN|nr:hypothetical protein E1298_24770 [Actinomadura rubrisoli]
MVRRQALHHRSPRTRLAALAVTGLTSAALITVPAATARAASPCWDAGFSRTTPWGYTARAFYCRNVSPTPVYGAATYGSGQVGTLNTATSWFLCKFDGGENNGSPAHPTRWIYTQADTPANTWGYVPDKKVYSETDAIGNWCFL